MFKSEWSELSVEFRRSPSAYVVVSPHIGVPSEIESQTNMAQRGGILVFARNASQGELHAIRLHETVEGPVCDGAESSRIDNGQPFQILSDGEFISRGYRSPSVFTNGGKETVLVNSETPLMAVAGDLRFDFGTLEVPSTLSVMAMASNISKKDEISFCLYMSSGNVYAGEIK